MDDRASGSNIRVPEGRTRREVARHMLACLDYYVADWPDDVVAELREMYERESRWLR